MSAKGSILPETQPLVCTVILNWNGLADTRECLSSLQRIDYGSNRVVVVENGSEGGEATALRQEFGEAIHLIESPTNLGFAGGANLGMRYALEQGADYVLLLNNDTTVDPAFLSALVEAAKGRIEAAALCPKSYLLRRTRRHLLNRRQREPLDRHRKADRARPAR